MAFQRTASIAFCIVITSAIAYGQRQSTTTAQPYRPSANISNPTYWDSDVEPLRRTHTRSESDGREVVVETVEGPDIDGRLAPLEEVVTETTHATDATETRQEVFRPGVNGRRALAERIESRQDRQSNGDTSAVYNRWAPDLNGRLRLESQLVEETRMSAPDVQRTDSTLLLPGVNEGLRATERTEHTRRQLDPDVLEHERIQSVRDVNGRWTAVEIRRGEIRKTGPSDRVEEETVQRPDVNGRLAITEMHVIRSSGTNEHEQEVVETYAGAAYERRLNGRPPLDQRIRRTTTAMVDGGRYTVEDVEQRSRVSPDEPLRVVRRIVTTVSPSGDGEWVTQRQIFELDVNGRLRLVRSE